VLGSDWFENFAGRAQNLKRRGDVLVVSIHWGSNWGYNIPEWQTGLAHRLIDEAGVDIVHGHSSHHVRPLEVYRGKLVLYGCGDFINDYEGISGHEEFRSDLRLMYFVTFDTSTGRLVRLRVVPMQTQRLRLVRASAEDSQWLTDLINRICDPFEVNFTLQNDGSMLLSGLSVSCGPNESRQVNGQPE
jgi:poly-gamma-glutamate synthesis protein (capsule biosynthesis protein)